MGGVVPRVGGDDEKDSSMAELPPSDLFGVEKPARINRFFYHVLGKFREIPKNLCQRVYQKIILSIFFIFLGKQIESTVLFVHYLPVEFFDDFIEAKIEFNFAFDIIASFSRRF